MLPFQMCDFTEKTVDIFLAVVSHAVYTDGMADGVQRAEVTGLSVEFIQSALSSPHLDP